MLIAVERIQEFCKSIEKACSDAKFIYFSVENGVSLYAESQNSCVYNLYDVKDDSIETDFKVGIEAKSLIALAKNLYPGDLDISFENNFVIIKKDNINAKFPTVAGRARLQILASQIIDQENAVNWITESLVKTTIAVESKTDLGKFSGVLLESRNGLSRICKFSGMSIFIASYEGSINDSGISNIPGRDIIPEFIVRIAKSFSKDILEYRLADGCVIVRLKNGTRVKCSKPHDTYMQEYLSYLGLIENTNMIPNNTEKYSFDVIHLANSIELVSAALGDSESWVKFSVIGKSSGKIVWNVSGKSQNGVEISEKLLSSGNSETDAFSINDKRSLKALACFGETVNISNLSNSVIGFSNDLGNTVILLTKVAV